MKTNPPRGMNDRMPDEMRIRDEMERTILDTYRQFGFSRIDTPIPEDAENLLKSDGGDNLNLIFQIMKRGDKLSKALEQQGMLWDLGLRYDLTLPLARFYAAHAQQLPTPFKSIQIGRAYRAERPQKGRFREFTQCDIDILGATDCTAEMELIAVTARALERLSFRDFTVKINDRRVLWRWLESSGIPDQGFASAAVALDKLDKVGLEGVAAELIERGMPTQAVDRIIGDLSAGMTLDVLSERIGTGEEMAELRAILEQTGKIAGDSWNVVFDPTLIRGQGYYTGAVFEIATSEFEGSIAGGGRYDGLIGRFTGKQTPAVGFSIGFERIAALLTEREQKKPPALKLIYAEDTPFSQVFAEAERWADAYAVTVTKQAGNVDKQVRKLKKDGYAVKILGSEDQPE